MYFYLFCALYALALLLSWKSGVSEAQVTFIIGVFAMFMWFVFDRTDIIEGMLVGENLDEEDIVLFNKLVSNVASVFALIAFVACFFSLTIAIAHIALNDS